MIIHTLNETFMLFFKVLTLANCFVIYSAYCSVRVTLALID